MHFVGCIAITIGLLAIASGFRLWFKAHRAEDGPKTLAKVAAIVIIIIAALVIVVVAVSGLILWGSGGGGVAGITGPYGEGTWHHGGYMMGPGHMTGPGGMMGPGGHMSWPEGMICPNCGRRGPGTAPGGPCPMAPATAVKAPATATKPPATPTK